MLVSKDQMLRLCPQYPRGRLDDDVRVFNEWAPKFGVSTPRRVRHFLAQCAHESGGFRYVEEIASGSAYEGRKDLGNTRKGDGVRYKGRGYIQLTGRRNYQSYQDSGYCVGDLMSHPEWLCQSPGRMKSALWFWLKSGCNPLADKDDIRTITKRVNGGLNGYAMRLRYLRLAETIFV